MSVGNSLRTFSLGFFVAVLVFATVFIARTGFFRGGKVSDSPSQRFTLSITTSISAVPGGTYRIIVREKATDDTVRDVSFKLSNAEETHPLRGTRTSIDWNEAKKIVDISVVDNFLIRISLT